MTASEAPSPRRSPPSSASRRGVLVVDGDLDCATAPLVAERLATDDSIRVVDLSRVTFMDAFALAALLAGVRRRRSAIEVRAPSPRVRRLLELAGLPDDLSWLSTSPPSDRRLR